MEVGTYRDSDISEADVREALHRLDPLWDELFPAEQARIVALLVERVDIGTDGVERPAARRRAWRSHTEMLSGGLGEAA